MKKNRGKYLIKYSTGVTNMMGETETAVAINTAREEGVNDPELLLVKITDLGGCVIRWKPKSIADWLKEV